MKFRKKPVVIEAVQWTGDNHDDIIDLAKGCERSIAFSNDGSSLMIATLEGNHLAGIGDWIIKGVHGELYPCKPDIFAATYDSVQDENDKPFQDEGYYLSAILVKDGVINRTPRYISAKKFTQSLLKQVANSIPDMLPDYWRNIKNEHADM